MSKCHLYKDTSSYFYKDKVIHPQCFEYKQDNNYSPGNVF